MEQCLLLFIKYPEKGKVKTRLAKGLGQDFALSLYKSFVLDILETLSEYTHNLIICYHPQEAISSIKKWLGNKYFYISQNGENLGERMKNAFTSVFLKGCSKAVIIGSDIPQISINVINEAFSELNKCDAVIGPSYDGGYYLIGFKEKSFMPEIFKKINWGTEKVFTDSMKIFKTKKYNVHVLPKLRDIDTVDDLKALYNDNKFTDFSNSRTMKLIFKLKNTTKLSNLKL